MARDRVERRWNRSGGPGPGMGRFAGHGCPREGTAIGLPGETHCRGGSPQVLETPGFRNGHWGILVVDAQDRPDGLRAERRPAVRPASVTKLFSTAAALIDWGPNTGSRRRWSDMARWTRRGRCKGDLILVAQGDLSWEAGPGPTGTLLFKDDDHTYSGGNLRARSWRPTRWPGSTTWPRGPGRGHQGGHGRRDRGRPALRAGRGTGSGPTPDQSRS